MKQNTLHILTSFLQQRKEVSYRDILACFPDKNETTITRNLNTLLKERKVIKKKVGKNTFYTFISTDHLKNYFDTPFFERPKVHYNPDFLEKYVPNTSSFLGTEGYQQLKTNYLDKYLLSTYDYAQNIREIENLIIDLSYTSSKLEGNTYSYLDTEVLIKYNEAAEGKSQMETQMVLNHKTAIKYIIENRQKI